MDSLENLFLMPNSNIDLLGKSNIILDTFFFWVGRELFIPTMTGTILLFGEIQMEAGEVV